MYGGVRPSKVWLGKARLKEKEMIKKMMCGFQYDVERGYPLHAIKYRLENLHDLQKIKANGVKSKALENEIDSLKDECRGFLDKYPRIEEGPWFLKQRILRALNR